MLSFFSFLVSIFFSNGIQAETIHMSVMAAAQGQSVYRGAPIWPKASALAGPSFTFFEKLVVRGPNIDFLFYNPRESSLEIELGIHYFDDNKPLFSFGKHSGDHRNQRKNSLESTFKFRYKFGYKKKFYIGSLLASDHIAYKGFYGEIHGGLPLLPFTSLNVKFSLADRSANQYFYGPESIGGYGHSSLGITFVIPFVPWDGVIINSFEKSWVLRGINQNADYVRGQGIQNVLSTRWIFNVF